MTISIPGLSLSILRQDTATQSGKPVLMTGRFTALGLGIPAFIRVSLEGPSYNPEIRTFDAFAQPFSGDYAVQVVTEKDGEYSVYAQAFPLPVLPSGPALPANLILLPPIAESTKPPLVVGDPFDGGVKARLPGGDQVLQIPDKTPIEIAVGAPSVFVEVASGGGFPGFPGLPPFITLPPTLAPYEPPQVTIPPIGPEGAPEIPAPAAPAPEIPMPPLPELPEAPELPEVPGLPGLPEIKIPTFPTVPSSGILGSPTADLPTELTIGE
jgi:hypothetical protein